MTIYTHNGVYYDLPTDDPELAKQKIMAHVGASADSQPKTVRDLQKQQLATVGDTVANAVTGTIDMLAYPLARQYYERIGGLSKEDAAARAVKETTSIKDPFGTYFGYKGQATYENAPQRKLGEFVGEGIQQGVVKPITEQSGLIESDVANMVNLGMMAGGAVAPKVMVPIKAAGGAVSDIATGAAGRFGTRPGIAKPGREPEVWQKPSALEPASKQYLPPEIKQQLAEGVITPEQAIAQSKDWTPEQVAALERTKGMVPLAEQKWQGVGEMLAAPYTSPKGWIPDVGLAALGYGVGALTGAGPLMAGLPPLLNLARKGYQATNAAKTISAADTLHNVGFTRMTPEMRAQLAQAQKNPQPLQPGPMPAAGAVNPQAMAAAKINPATATTPAAQAAVNTTEAKVQAQTPEPMPTAATAPTAIPEPQVQPVAQPKPTLQETIAKFKTPAEMRRALYTTVPSDKLEALIKQRFPPETPAVKPAMVETPEGTAVRTADDAMREFMDQQRGIVRGDVATTRQNFIKNIEETKVNLTAAREENKKLYGDLALSMNPNAGKGSFMPNPKDNINTKAVVRHMIKSTGIGEIRQANKKISVNRDGYDALADQAGVVLDWSTAPRVRDMGLADARKAINKWVYKSIDQQYPELGLTARQESRSVQQRRADRERAAEEAAMTPEQRAQRDAEIQATLPDLRARMNRFQGIMGKKPEMPKSTSAATPEVAGPVVPEGAVETPKTSVNDILEMIKNRQKNNKPSGTMEMITNEPTAVSKIKAAEWLTPEEFDSQVFMHTLGKDADKEFIAKMKTPEGSVIKAIDKELNSEAIQYADGSGLLVRKYREVPGAEDYSIFNTDGTRYEIQKFSDGIRKIEIKKGDNIVAEYIKSSNEKTGKWAVIDRNAEGGGQMIYKGDLKFAKNPNTRNLHNKLPKINFEEIIAEQLGKAEDLKKGK